MPTRFQRARTLPLLHSTTLPLSCASKIIRRRAESLAAYVNEEGHPGYVYQVKGDAENMRYQPSGGKVNITALVDMADQWQWTVKGHSKDSLLSVSRYK